MIGTLPHSKGAPRRESMLEHPHAVLLAAVAAVLALEGFRGARTIGTAPVWPVSQALVGAVALGLVWRRQELLRLRSLLALALVFEIGWVVLHLALGVHSDFESANVYPREGNALLHGHYPDTEYPPGAILLFALEALVSGGSGEGVRVAHAFMMVPFQLATVAGVWALRTRWSGWFAALVAVWPLNAFFWEFKFDAAPTAALVLGLVLALRERWPAAGALFGLGAALKWTPGLAAAALVLWLLCSRRRRDAGRHALGFAGAFLLVNVPFLALWPGLVLHTYNVQGSRGISGESFLYLPLRLLGRAELVPGGEIWSDAVVPGWAKTAAIVLQLLSVLAVFAVAVRVRARTRAGVAVAAMAPVAFLLTNRVFSPQYLVTILAAWAVAGALLARSTREQLALAVPMLGATLANVLVYPTVTPTYWWVCSGVLFVFAFAATLWVLLRAVTARSAKMQL
jgi:Glycosyltransferase family 87